MTTTFIFYFIGIICTILDTNKLEYLGFEFGGQAQNDISYGIADIAVSKEVVVNKDLGVISTQIEKINWSEISIYKDQLGVPYGYVYVQFQSIEDAKDAFVSLNGTQIDQQFIILKFAHTADKGGR
ncbi:MAG: hypothetical protein EZS28_003445 [Streblomastix strix]|uniref:RRM domain-containing protein n=1 Tax=Streblomastix strix TaxID=222440 RepID=A0A5J4X2N7_9EUKA|nr:MAG: hypothetical protein EZS28_003445 [Streblomastix strix]